MKKYSNMNNVMKRYSILLAYILYIIVYSTLLSGSPSKIFVSSFGFKISSKWDRCFYEEYKKESNPLFNYMIYGTENIEQENLLSAMNNVIIKIYYTIPEKKYRNLVTHKSIETPKGKFAINVQESGLYQICITFYSGYWEKRLKLTMSFKTTTDTTNIPSLSGVVMGEHVENMHLSLRNAMSSVEGMINSQQYEMQLEEEDKVRMENTAFFFYSFTLIQVFTILGLFIYQIIKYKKIKKREDEDD